jgi:membrane associated rhomboid family serine protease
VTCLIQERVGVKVHVPCQKDCCLSDTLETKPPVQAPAPMFNIPWVVLVVIGVLFAIHLALEIAGTSWQISAQYVFAFIPTRFTSVIFSPIKGSGYWSMLTYGLLHADWTHLGFNSLWLLIFSKPVALRLGSLRYLVLLAVSVIAGAVAGLIVHWGEFVVMVGISAGVSGVMAAAIPIIYAHGGMWSMTTANQTAHLRPLTPLQIVTQRTPLMFTIVWLGLQMATATSQYMTATAFLNEHVIAWEAHLGGFLAGFILFYVLDRKPVPPPPNL